MKAFGSRPSNPTPAPAQSTTPTAPSRPVAVVSPPAAAPPTGRRAFGAGLPPPDPNAGDGTSFDKRDAAYWAAHPIAPGSYTFDLYVAKIVWWLDNGVTVTLRVSQWDRTANRPGEHHGRDIRWDQTPGTRTGAAFNFWRGDLVGAYTAGGMPEDSWPKDKDNNPCPPWPYFWVHQCADGLSIPVMLSGLVTVTPPSARGGSFMNVKKIARIQVPDGGHVQAPMPFELPIEICEMHGWSHGDLKTIMKDGRAIASVVPVAKDCVPLGHLGMTTYKDL